MDFAQLLCEIPNKSEWVRWLCEDTGKDAKEILAFLSACYSNIPSSKKGNIKNRLKNADEDNIDSFIPELVTHEFLRRLNLKPEWCPKIERQTPDLMFTYDNKNIIADVFLVHSPKKTIKRKNDNLVTFWDSPLSQDESRSTKIERIISEKSEKYSKSKYPLVLFGFLGDNLGLDVQKVETALYGDTVDEILKNKTHFENKKPYPNLSAVIACKWFDIANIANPEDPIDEGRALRCNVLHNPHTKYQLPLAAFSSFGQIDWHNESGDVSPHYIGNSNMIAKFWGTDEIEFKPYSIVIS